MSIDNKLLISAPMLQDYLVDKDSGFPMAGGVLTFYQDYPDRTVLKNLYYQTGNPPTYSYTKLPNPLTLSSVGTIQDNNGNDTIPYFYPVSELDEEQVELYYVTCVNSDSVPQWTRSGFPNVNQADDPTPPNLQTLENIITNNVFWRNNGDPGIVSSHNSIICGGDHDGFNILGGNLGNNYSDVRFLKNALTATDSISFDSLNGTVFFQDTTPEFCLTYSCTEYSDDPPIAENLKSVQWPICLHVDTLARQVATVTVWAKCFSGNNQLNVGIFQFLGTGVSSPAVFHDAPQTITNVWTIYTFHIQLPSSIDTIIGKAGDDALFLQIMLPLNAETNISFTKPSMYLGDTRAINSYQSYDYISSIISANRTGDVRVSLNSWGPFGWVAMNDGTIGDAISNATTRANIDTWQLFNFIWNTFKTGDQTLAQMYTSAGSGSPVSYGSTAYADWIANNQISLTKQLGRVISSIGIPSTGGSTNHGIGVTNGEQKHMQLTDEVGPHNHTVNILSPGGGASVEVVDFEVKNSQTRTPPTSTGYISVNNNTYVSSQLAFNVIQPTSYLNFFMKL